MPAAEERETVEQQGVAGVVGTRIQGNNPPPVCSAKKMSSKVRKNRKVHVNPVGGGGPSQHRHQVMKSSARPGRQLPTVVQVPVRFQMRSAPP